MKYISYYRVSTKKQGDSHLGLDAQQTEINRFISNTPESEVIAEYTEIETGTNKKTRPILSEAIKHSIESDSILLIAKLDRLSRNVQFISSLMDSKVKFKALDMPIADPFTIHILAAVAQKEAEDISERTKKALSVIKDKLNRGEEHTSKSGNKVTRLGGVRVFNSEDRSKGSKALTEKAATNINNRLATPLILALTEQGKNYRDISEELNKAGYKTSRGKQFTPMQVYRLAPKKNTKEEKQAYREYLQRTALNEELYKQLSNK